MGGDTVIQAQPQPSYGESMRESLQAQVDLAPELYQAEASQQYGRPAYAQLETDILRDTLLGAERFVPDPGQEDAIAAQAAQATPTTSVAGGRYQTIMRPGAWDERKGQQQFSVDLIDPQTGEVVMSETGSYAQRDPFGGPDASGMDSEAIGQAMQSLFGAAQEQGLMTAPEATTATQEAITGTIERDEGLLQLIGGKEAGYRDGEFQGLATYGTDIAKEAATRQREADIGDVETFGVRASEAIKAADPLSAQLLGTMGTQAQEELAAGGDLTQRQREGAIQDARLGWEARGRVRDPGAVVSELENLERAREMRKAQRRGFAGQVMGQSRAMSADPFMSILGRPSGASQQIATGAMGGAQYGLGAGPQLYGPESGLSYMLGQQTNQANLQAAQAAANATRQAGMMGMVGKIAGAGVGAYPWGG